MHQRPILETPCPACELPEWANIARQLSRMNLLAVTSPVLIKVAVKLACTFDATVITAAGFKRSPWVSQGPLKAPIEALAYSNTVTLQSGAPSMEHPT